MVRWPFLGPGAEGLREELEGFFRDFIAPWAICGFGRWKEEVGMGWNGEGPRDF